MSGVRRGERWFGCFSSRIPYDDQRDDEMCSTYLLWLSCARVGGWVVVGWRLEDVGFYLWIYDFDFGAGGMRDS